MVCAPPRVLPRSLAPAGVLGGGRSGPGSPLLGLGLWGWRKGVPGGGACHCCEGRLGSGAPPPPTARPLGGLLGSATHLLWAWVCGCGGPTLSPWPARPVGAAYRGGGRGPSPYRAWGCAPPVGRVRGVRVPKGGLGGGGGVRRAPRLCGWGGPVGRRVAMPRSVPLPSLGRQRSGCHWRRSVHGGRGSRYHSGSCSPAFTGRDLCGVLARWRGLACSPWFLWEPAAGAGGRAALRLLSRAGGGGTIPPASGGGGRGPRGLRAGGGDGGGGSPHGLPAPPLGGSPRFPTLATLLSSAHSPQACACGRGRGAAPGLGGMRGGPWTAPPGALADLNPPFALPEWAVVMGGSWGARPPYCSGAPSPGLVRALLRRAGVGSPVGRDPRGSRRLGALGRAVCRSSRITPPLRRGPFWGRGGVPSAPGGQSPQAGGGSGGGGGGGGVPPPPPPRRASACHPLSPACPSGVHSCRRGCRAAAGVRRGPVGRQLVSAAGGGGRGGGTPPPWFAPPSSPGRPLKGPLRLRHPGRRRSAVGRQRAGRAGACLGRGAPSPRVQRPPQGGCGAAVSSVCLRPLLGLRGRGGGGEWGGPSGPLAPPPDGRGGAAWRSRPRGPAVGRGVALFPRPPRAGPRWGPSSPPPSSRGAGRPGAAMRVSGQRFAGCGAVGSPPRSLSPPSLPREVARAPPSRRIVGGAWVGGPSSPPHFLVSAVWAVTCAAACVGAGAVAAAGCAGGSASGRGRCARPGGASCWRPRP